MQSMKIIKRNISWHRSCNKIFVFLNTVFVFLSFLLFCQFPFIAFNIIAVDEFSRKCVVSMTELFFREYKFCLAVLKNNVAFNTAQAADGMCTVVA